MNQDDLKQEISKSKIRNLYIFCSDDYLLKQAYIDRIEKVSKLQVFKYDYYTYENFTSEILNLCYGDLFCEKSVRVLKLHFELKELPNIFQPSNILIIDPLGCCEKLKFDFVVRFRPLNKNEIKSYLNNKAENLEPTLVNKIIQSKFYSNATALNLLVQKIILSQDVQEIDFLDKEFSDFEVLEAILEKNFAKFDALCEKYSEPPLKLLSFLSSIFYNAFLELKGLSKQPKPFYKRITKLIKEEELENLLLILYDLDKLYKSANMKDLLVLKIKIFNWMEQK